jgi:NAD-dependent deacetylase sirtuin 2
MRAEPTAVVSWQVFRHNQLPYLELRRPFILGVGGVDWRPTIAHYFPRICKDKGVLGRVFTQNIDGLDYQTGLDPADIVSVHGTMAQAKCDHCEHRVVDFASFQQQVRRSIKDIYHVDPNAPVHSTEIACERCGKPGVKPATVMYGQQLPEAFSEACARDCDGFDLLLVSGTALVVSPANSLVNRVAGTCSRVVVNREPVGEDLGLTFVDPASAQTEAAATRPTSAREDLFIGGDADVAFLDLIEELGWLSDLDVFRDALTPASQMLLDARCGR